jgi:hypothetical protein
MGDRAPKERLQALRANADALRQKEKEITARKEARRLSDTASRKDAARKTD